MASEVPSWLTRALSYGSGAPPPSAPPDEDEPRVANAPPWLTRAIASAPPAPPTPPGDEPRTGPLGAEIAAAGGMPTAALTEEAMYGKPARSVDYDAGLLPSQKVPVSPQALTALADANEAVAETAPPEVPALPVPMLASHGQTEPPPTPMVMHESTQPTLAHPTPKNFRPKLQEGRWEKEPSALYEWEALNQSDLGAAERSFLLGLIFPLGSPAYRVAEQAQIEGKDFQELRDELEALPDTRFLRHSPALIKSASDIASTNGGGDHPGIATDSVTNDQMYGEQSALQRLADAWLSGVAQVRGSAAGLGEAAAEGVSPILGALELLKQGGPAAFSPLTPQSVRDAAVDSPPLVEAARQKRKDYEEIAAGLMPDEANLLERAAASGPNTLAILASAAAGPAGPIVTGGLSAFSPAYTEARDRGVGKGTAALAAGAEGAVSGVLERIGVEGMLGQAWRSGKGVLAQTGKQIAEAIAAEVPTEAAQELTSSLKEAATGKYDSFNQWWGDTHARMIEAAKVAAVTAGAVGSVAAVDRRVEIAPEVYPYATKGGLDAVLVDRPEVPVRTDLMKGGESLPLPALGDGVRPEDVSEAWSYLSTRHPVIAGRVQGIVGDVGRVEAWRAYVDAQDRIHVRPGTKISPETLAHELTHVAQRERDLIPRETREQRISRLEAGALHQDRAYRKVDMTAASAEDLTKLPDEDLAQRVLDVEAALKVTPRNGSLERNRLRYLDRRLHEELDDRVDAGGKYDHIFRRLEGEEEGNNQQDAESPVLPDDRQEEGQQEAAEGQEGVLAAEPEPAEESSPLREEERFAAFLTDKGMTEDDYYAAAKIKKVALDVEFSRTDQGPGAGWDEFLAEHGVTHGDLSLEGRRELEETFFQEAAQKKLAEPKEVKAETPPPPTAPETNSASDLAEGLGDMGAGIADGLYRSVWERLEAGKSPSPFAIQPKPEQAVLAAYERGEVKSVEDVKRVMTAEAKRVPPQVKPGTAQGGEEGPKSTRAAVAPTTSAAPLTSVAETKGGKKLLDQIQRDPRGAKVGVRTINEYLLSSVGSEMRVGREQTTKKNPARYFPVGHLVRARTGNSITYGTHEAGHAISALLRDKTPKVFEGLKNDLVAVTKMNGSVASAKTAEEGVAEWVRRYVSDPASLGSMDVTTKMEAAIGNANPETLAAIRDAARAWSAHSGRDVSARFRSQSKVKPPTPPVKQQAQDAIDTLLFSVASRRRGIHRLENKIYSAFKQYAAETRRKGEAQARQFLRSVKDTQADVERSYQATIHVVPEVLRAVEGVRHGKNGVRVADEQGNYQYYTDESLSDIVGFVGEANWEEFETYGQMKASLSREEKGQDRIGKTSGITNKQIVDEVSQLETDNPTWPDAFDKVRDYADGLLDASVDGGLMKAEDASRMKDAYKDYWPLLRDLERQGTSAGGGRIDEADPGFRRSFGGEQPLLPILEGLRRRTYDVLSAYYWNRAILAPVKLAEALRKTDAPLLVKATADRVSTRLDPRLESRLKVATLTPEEAQKIIADWMNYQALPEDHELAIAIREAVEDEELEAARAAGDEALRQIRELSGEEFEKLAGRPKTKPSDIAVWFNPGDVFRQKSPKDTALNVVVPRVRGERQFYQIEDPLLFDLYAKVERPAKFFEYIGKLLTPMTAPWKRVLTQNVVFVMGNLPRDASTATFFGTGPESLVPGFYALNGLLGRLTGRAADAASGGELLSRTLDHASRPTHRKLVDSFKGVASEGIILKNWKQMSGFDKLLAVPGVGMSTIMKPVELGLWATGQRYLSELSESLSREGAYLQAKKKGFSDETAQIAFDITTGNFGERPGNADLHSIYKSAGFLNPAVQTTYEIGRKLTHPDSHIRNAAYGRIAWAGVLAAAGWAVNKLITPADRELELEERPDEDRLTYMPIGGYVRIPFDYGPIGAIQSYTWNTLDAHFGGKPPVQKKAMARLVLKRLLDLPGHPMAFVQPQIKALLENEANYVWYYDEQIERDWMKYLPAEDRAYHNTPKIYRWLSSKTGWGPLKVQHFVQAGLSQQIDQAFKMAEMIEEGKPIEEPADIPFIGRRMIREPAGWWSQSVISLSEIDGKYDQLKARLKKLEEAEAPEEKLAALESEIEKIGAMHESMSEVRELYKAVKEAQAAKDYKEARELSREMTRVAAQALSRGSLGTEGN